MAAAVAAIAPEAWHLVNAASANSYPAQVSSFGLVPLNFQQSGARGALDVKVGQHVRAGQILASESTVTSSALVARDRSAVAADEQRLHVLESLANGAGVGSAASVAASYQSEINAAESALTTAENAFTPELASANAQVASLQSQYSTVEGIFRQQCPGGPAATNVRRRRALPTGHPPKEGKTRARRQLRWRCLWSIRCRPSYGQATGR